MSDLYRDGCSIVRVTSPVRHPSTLDATPAMEPPSCRIQRWIGDPHSNPIAIRDSDELKARQEYDHHAEVDWELEEFEREMALRFVMRDLELVLEEHRSRTHTYGRLPEPNACSDVTQPKQTLQPWLRPQSSSATIQPSSPQPQPLSPATSSNPSIPRTPTLSCPAPPPTSPAIREHARSGSLPGRPTHRSSPSVLSLTSHFSSCTSSTSHTGDTDPETSTGLEAPPNGSVRSLVSHLGQKIRHGLVPPPVPTHLPRPKTATPLSIVDLVPPGSAKKKRRVSVPASIGPKKRRLVVRGVRMDDNHAVEGIRRWACRLGEVSRLCRAQDGAIWIEFRDRRVAENVCCLQAQVQIPHVGSVTLDWAEGRQPG
ncbi:hypothetical protein K439DRAFT_1627503 [Ramaria rubella]|nr:hypothetical protein K439DRAFT_1627503 [Ramaria rubella]